LPAFIREVSRHDAPPDTVLAALAQRLADRWAPDIDRAHAGPLLDGTIRPVALDGVSVVADAGPALLGDALELLDDRTSRRRRGAFFTPHERASLLVHRATQDWAWPDRPKVCDPACGGGAFLLAAAQLLERRGYSRRAIVGELLWGVDTDPLSVTVSATVLRLWAASAGQDVAGLHVTTGDTLRAGLASWPDAAERFDLVVGNPPFQSQLSARTARSRALAAELDERFGSVSRGYADNAAVFLVASASMTADGGRLSLLQPESFLAARDAGPARQAMTERAALVGLWLPRERLFDASVRVCAPVFEVGSGQPSTIRRWRGADAEPAADTGVPPAGLGGGSTWAPLAADLFGAPAVELADAPSIGSIASATAGFRDQFYGLVPFVASADQLPHATVRLVTSGAIDLVNDLWARRVTAFARLRLQSPVVDMDRLRVDAPELAAWAQRVLVPKVVVATQTRVIELVVDEEGDVWPSVPTVAVVAPRDQLWRVAAALASPALSALGLARHAGAALAGDAIKLSASQILDLPLPTDVDAWDEGAMHLQSASVAATQRDGAEWSTALERFASSMSRAYGTSDEVRDWWLERVPAFR
jgi:hypothetical protein